MAFPAAPVRLYPAASELPEPSSAAGGEMPWYATAGICRQCAWCACQSLAAQLRVLSC